MSDLATEVAQMRVQIETLSAQLSDVIALFLEQSPANNSPIVGRPSIIDTGPFGSVKLAEVEVVLDYYRDLADRHPKKLAAIDEMFDWFLYEDLDLEDEVLDMIRRNNGEKEAFLVKLVGYQDEFLTVFDEYTYKGDIADPSRDRATRGDRFPNIGVAFQTKHSSKGYSPDDIAGCVDRDLALRFEIIDNQEAEAKLRRERGAPATGF